MYNLRRLVWYAIRVLFRNLPITRGLKAEVRYGLLRHKFLASLVADTSHPGSVEPFVTSPLRGAIFQTS